MLGILQVNVTFFERSSTASSLTGQPSNGYITRASRQQRTQKLLPNGMHTTAMIWVPTMKTQSRMPRFASFMSVLLPVSVS